MNISKFTLIILSICCLGACKNDIEINAPWQEIPVVYGLLDVNQTVQYIRIQKAYQNSINQTTAEGAQIGDSLYLKDLVVMINSDTFKPVDTIAKDPGFFAQNTNTIFAGKVSDMNLNKTMVLSIQSIKTGKTYIGKTSLVGPATMKSYFMNFNTFINPSDIQLVFNAPEKSYTFDGILRFKYKEYPTGNSASATTYTIDYQIPNSYLFKNSNYVIPNLLFINYLKEKILPKAGFDREIVSIDFLAIGGSKELKDFIDITTPSSSIVQKKVDYSNIEGGALGIFSSRSQTPFLNLDIKNVTGNTQRQNLIDALNSKPSQYTDVKYIINSDLKFVN